MITRAEIERVSLRDRKVLLKNGEVLPITNLMRGDEEVQDPILAFSIVAGPMLDGNWLCMTVGVEDLGLDL